jgi:hypothetical protein
VLIRCFLFTLRLSFSGKAVHPVFATQAQEAFLEGHLHAFAAVGQDFEAERPFLRPLSAEPFEPGLTLHPLVDRYARIPVRQSHYSVPSSLIGRRVRVSCGPRS